MLKQRDCCMLRPMTQEINISPLTGVRKGNSMVYLALTTQRLDYRSKVIMQRFYSALPIPNLKRCNFVSILKKRIFLHWIQCNADPLLWFIGWREYEWGNPKHSDAQFYIPAKTGPLTFPSINPTVEIKQVLFLVSIQMLYLLFLSTGASFC